MFRPSWSASLIAALLIGGSALAQPSAAPVWRRTPRGTLAEVQDRWVFAEVVDQGRVHVRITRVVLDVEETTFEQTIEGPHWQSPLGEPCQAMGVAGADFVRLGAHVAIRIEVSVSDLCETRAPAFTLLRLPVPLP